MSHARELADKAKGLLYGSDGNKAAHLIDQLATRAELEQHILQKVAQLATGQRNSMDLTTEEVAHLKTLLGRPDA